MILLYIFFLFSDSTANFTQGIMNTTQIPIKTSCETYMEIFANSAANFTFCLISSSRPFTVCQSCLQQYLQSLHSYDVLMKTTSEDPNESCGAKLGREDQVQMVAKVYDFVKDSWVGNYCPSCYEDMENGTFANHTIEFHERMRAFDSCIFDNLGFHLPYILPGELNVNRTICTTCLSTYQNLSNFYSTLDPNFDGKFCMDLSDSMNFTWKVWHEDFHCYLHRENVDVCVATSFFIALIPSLFYFIAKICSSDITKIFLREKRLNETTITTTVSLDE